MLVGKAIAMTVPKIARDCQLSNIKHGQFHKFQCAKDEVRMISRLDDVLMIKHSNNDTATSKLCVQIYDVIRSLYWKNTQSAGLIKGSCYHVIAKSM